MLRQDNIVYQTHTHTHPQAILIYSRFIVLWYAKLFREQHMRFARCATFRLCCLWLFLCAAFVLGARNANIAYIVYSKQSRYMLLLLRANQSGQYGRHTADAPPTRAPNIRIAREVNLNLRWHCECARAHSTARHHPTPHTSHARGVCVLRNYLWLNRRRSKECARDREWRGNCVLWKHQPHCGCGRWSSI